MDELGFRASVSDPCLFFRRSTSGRLMLLFLFVDDFQVSYHREDKAEWNRAVEAEADGAGGAATA